MAEPSNTGLTQRQTGNSESNTATGTGSSPTQPTTTSVPSGTISNPRTDGNSGESPNPHMAVPSGTTANPPRAGPSGTSSNTPTAGPSSSGASSYSPTAAGPSGASSSQQATTSTSGSSAASGSAGLTPPPTVQYEGYKGNMTEYCSQLENWLWRCYWQRECAVSAYYTALSLMFPGNRGYGPHPPGTVPPVGQGFLYGSQDPNGAAGPGNAFQRPVGMNNNNAGAWNLNIPRQGHANPIVRRFVVRGIRTNNNTFAIDFNIAPIWKRFLAECIDFIILLVVKLFVTLTIIDNFDLIDLDNIDLDAVQEAKNLVDMALALSWELVILEFTHRIVVCFFEAYCLAKGGATPGKSFMGLRVLHCEQVIPIANAPNNMNPVVGGVGVGSGSRVLVSPGSFLNFPRALLRSTVKNFSLAFFFPLCFTLFHFEHNRTLYDLSSKSIVVEIRPQQ